MLKCSRSDSAISCSRIRLPSFSAKLRTQPTWSAGSSRSMRDGPTAGCQAQWLLKSRISDQTTPIGASITAERVTLITGARVASAR